MDKRNLTVALFHAPDLGPQSFRLTVYDNNARASLIGFYGEDYSKEHPGNPGDDRPTLDAQIADAWLFAAAPEMLDVVRRVVAWSESQFVDEIRTIVKQAREAILKAEGKGPWNPARTRPIKFARN